MTRKFAITSQLLDQGLLGYTNGLVLNAFNFLTGISKDFEFDRHSDSEALAWDSFRGFHLSRGNGSNEEEGERMCSSLVGQSQARAQEKARRRALAALSFFLDVLDPEERDEKPVYEIYRACFLAIKLGYRPSSNLLDYLSKNSPPPANSSYTSHNAVSSSQTSSSSSSLPPYPAVLTVLTLCDTVDIIVSHISSQTLSGLNALVSLSMLNRTFYESVQDVLWREPRDLECVRRQVRFGFALAISRASLDYSSSYSDGDEQGDTSQANGVAHAASNLGLGPGLGPKVHSLSVLWLLLSTNFRLLHFIASHCPNVTHVLIQRGTPLDAIKHRRIPDPLTKEGLVQLHDYLACFSNMKMESLELYKWSVNSCEDPGLSESLPSCCSLITQPDFSRLAHLTISGFTWAPYWDDLASHIPTTLKSLEISDDGLTSRHVNTSLSALARKLPHLTTLSILSPSIEPSVLKAFTSTARGLREIYVCFPGRREHDADDEDPRRTQRGDEIIKALSGLEDLQDLSLLHHRFSPSQVNDLTKTLKRSLTYLKLKLQNRHGQEAYADCITGLLRRNRELVHVCIEFEGSTSGLEGLGGGYPSYSAGLYPTEAFVSALADLKHLEGIHISLYEPYLTHSASPVPTSDPSTPDCNPSYSPAGTSPIDDISPSQSKLIHVSVLEKVLQNCPNLTWSDDLDRLMRGCAVYINEFREKLENERDLDDEWVYGDDSLDGMKLGG